MPKGRRSGPTRAALRRSQVHLEQNLSQPDYFSGRIFETSATIFSISLSFRSPFLKE